MHKIEPFLNNYVVNPDLLVFCAPTCDRNLICAIKYFIATIFLNDFFVIAVKSFMTESKPSVSTHFKQSVISSKC